MAVPSSSFRHRWEQFSLDQGNSFHILVPLVVGNKVIYVLISVFTLGLSTPCIVYLGKCGHL